MKFKGNYTPYILYIYIFLKDNFSYYVCGGEGATIASAALFNAYIYDDDDNLRSCVVAHYTFLYSLSK